ncbi:MAG: hypothetical protein LQ337_005945 [Flavoplaca oasis]|nr:MAG: hypothetical protein LQ337_005945 [Flavoplaca oasis]
MALYEVRSSAAITRMTFTDAAKEIIWLNAQWIAARYPAPQRAQYRAAARTLRIPFWDWSLDATMPPEVSQPTIYINAPEGTVNVPNPLYSYTFHPLPSEDEFPPIGSSPNGPKVWSFQSTVRYPDSNNQSQPDLVNRQLQANGAALHSMTYALLTQQPDYGPFSNTRYDDARGLGRYNNIENIHNGIHMLIEDINTPLSPFHEDDSGTLWTSARAWSTRTFGYSYPGINDWAVNSSQLSTNVKTRLNELYNPTRRTSERSVSANALGNMRLLPNAMDIQWLINIAISKSDIPSPFFVHIYLGSAPTDPSTWSFAPNLVASHSVLDTSMLNTAGADMPAKLYGQIPLNPALLAAGNTDLSSSKMVPLLKSQLNWRLQSTDDAPIEIGKLPSLKIHVVGQDIKPRVSADEFPEYGTARVYKEVTNGKAGGLQNGDDVK